MTTFKFLAEGARGPFTGHRWSAEWGATGGAPELGRRGFHVCRPDRLAFWIHDELWETETAGVEIEANDCLVAERARLVRRVPFWDKLGARRFVEACIAHASENASNAEYLGDAENAMDAGYPAVAAYSAALATADLRAERIWQSGWLEREIALRT